MKAGQYLVPVLAILLVLSCSTIFAQTKTPKIRKRQINQQERIIQGRKSGELTKAETIRLEKQQKKIQKDKIKAKSDGVVTPRERAKLHAEQNRTSRTIYRKKHNLRKD